MNDYRSSASSDLLYLPHVAVLCYFDNTKHFRVAHSRSTPTEQIFGHLKEPTARFDSRCRDYRSALESTDSCRLDSFLYRPIHFHALGHSDAISLVLADDLKAVIELTSHIHENELATLAYLPDVRSLVGGGLAADFLMAPSALVGDGPSATLPEHTSESRLARSPLCTITTFKLNNLALLNHGLLFQQQVFRATAQLIQCLCSALCDNAMSVGLLGPNDVEQTRFLIMDPQGADDVLLLSLTSNYSVPLTIVSAMRELTIGDLLQGEGGQRLACAMDDPALGSMHEVFASVACRLKKKEKGNSKPSVLLQYNHVFSGSYTTLAATPTIFDSGLTFETSGFMAPTLAMTIGAGHNRAAAHLVESAVERASIADASSEPVSPSEYTLIAVGRHSRDITFEECVTQQASPEQPTGRRQYHVSAQPLIPTKDYLAILRSLLLTAMQQDDAHESGVLDLCTNVSIPVPTALDSYLNRPVHEHHLPGIAVIQEMAERLTGPLGRLSPEAVATAASRLQLPWSYRHTLAYLFQEFGACLRDPQLYEAVLDLFEVFAAVANLLVKGYPSHLESCGADADSTRRALALLHDKR